MATIHSVQLQRMRNNVYIQFMRDAASITAGSDPAVLGIKQQYDALAQENIVLENSFLQLKKSLLTSRIGQTDDIRDNIINGIEGICQSYLLHYLPDYVNAAEMLLNHIRKHGEKIARMSYQAETTALNDLIDFVKTDDELQNAVQQLHLTDWFTELEAQNKEFNRLYLLRIGETAEKPKTNMRELRGKTDGLYYELIKHISAHSVINPSEALAALINKLNALIDKYNALKPHGGTDNDNGDDKDNTDKPNDIDVDTPEDTEL